MGVSPSSPYDLRPISQKALNLFKITSEALVRVRKALDGQWWSKKDHKDDLLGQDLVRALEDPEGSQIQGTIQYVAANLLDDLVIRRRLLDGLFRHCFEDGVVHSCEDLELPGPWAVAELCADLDRKRSSASWRMCARALEAAPSAVDILVLSQRETETEVVEGIDGVTSARKVAKTWQSAFGRNADLGMVEWDQIWSDAPSLLADLFRFDITRGVRRRSARQLEWADKQGHRGVIPPADFLVPPGFVVMGLEYLEKHRESHRSVKGPGKHQAEFHDLLDGFEAGLAINGPGHSSIQMLIDEMREKTRAPSSEIQKNSRLNFGEGTDGRR